jgi:hypothetical protein
MQNGDRQEHSREKKERIPFFQIASFFLRQMAQFNDIGSDPRRDCS